MPAIVLTTGDAGLDVEPTAMPASQSKLKRQATPALKHRPTPAAQSKWKRRERGLVDTTDDVGFCLEDPAPDIGLDGSPIPLLTVKDPGTLLVVEEVGGGRGPKTILGTGEAFAVCICASPCTRCAHVPDVLQLLHPCPSMAWSDQRKLYSPGKDTHIPSPFWHPCPPQP